MPRLLLAIVASVLAVAVWLPGAVAAQSPGGDSVVGHADFLGGSNEPLARIDFEVHSGPSGENPQGDVDGQTVGCLHVSGNTAVVGLEVGDQGAFFFSLVDAAVDRWTLSRAPGPVAPDDCRTRFSAPSGGAADVVVTDAGPPTRYAECRQGGWVSYGFVDHPSCIASVHGLARQKCIFERVAHGITAFRAKYGLPPDQHHAMRHCVRLYTGF
jgi:hypothetical protein